MFVLLKHLVDECEILKPKTFLSFIDKKLFKKKYMKGGDLTQNNSNNNKLEGKAMTKVSLPMKENYFSINLKILKIYPFS